MRGHGIQPLFLSLNGLAGVILALFLWLLPMNPWSYAVGAIVLACLVALFICFVPLPWSGYRLIIARSAACIFATALLAAVLAPEGIARFNPGKSEKTPQAPTPTVVNTGSGASGINQNGSRNSVTIGPSITNKITQLPPQGPAGAINNMGTIGDVETTEDITIGGPHINNQGYIGRVTSNNDLTVQ